MRDWVLFDYGGVLCTDQPAADRQVLPTAAGLDPATLRELHEIDLDPEGET